MWFTGECDCLSSAQDETEIDCCGLPRGDGYYREVQGYIYPDSPYLLPIIQNSKQDEYRQYSKMLRLHNYRLRQVGYFLKIREQLSTYVARHTWATTALRQNYNSSLICDAMGHSSIKVTETYFQRYREDEVNRLNNALVAFVLSKKV